MKEAVILKKNASDVAGPEDMELINNFARKTLAPEDVYIFSLILCDNEIDRDFERFSTDALKPLASMYVGKTGIFDHDAKSGNQAARIFWTEVIEDPSITTAAGEKYCAVKAKAYMLKSPKNKELIDEIDAGIKKEVSVGCCVQKVSCSVCGADLKQAPCAHKKGKRYGGELCHAVLSEPADAYEWSFVAVPAQPKAGVTKAHKPAGPTGERDADTLFSLIKSAAGGVNLTRGEAACLAEAIAVLELKAADGETYRADLEKQVRGLCAVAMPELDAGAFGGLGSRMSIAELRAFKSAFESRAGEFMPVPQLATVRPEPAGLKDARNSQFKI